MNSKICLIGDIVIDVTLKNKASPLKMRLGGIAHMARCLWALEIPYSVAYFAPDYLDKQITKYLAEFGCCEAIKLGNVTGAPYVFLIEDVKEAGDQGYEFLLRDELTVSYDLEALRKLSSKNYEDCLLISGNYDISKLNGCLSGNIHLDVANNMGDLALLDKFQYRLESIFTSTSSDFFKQAYKGDFLNFAECFRLYTNQVILKENRGGSRGYCFTNNEFISTPSQTRPIIHSVGVGDVYDASHIIHHRQSGEMEESMTFASWMAAEYASTTYPDDFKTNAQRILKSNIRDLVKLGGVYLPWEAREQINIYIAAPDFDFVDRHHVDLLASSLLYHNFRPRRPVQENGQMEKDATKARRMTIFSKDMELINECKIMVAVLLYNDPGTLIEIGIAATRGIPTIVYDPYCIATNCMLTELPDLVTHDLDEVISEVFIKSAKLI